MKQFISVSLVLLMGSMIFAPAANASDGRGDFHAGARRGPGQIVQIKETTTVITHRVSGRHVRHRDPGFRDRRFKFRRPHHSHHRRAVIVSHQHPVVPGAVIAGGVIGGIVGHEIGHGSTAATAAGALLGSALGHELSRDAHRNNTLRRVPR